MDSRLKKIGIAVSILVILTVVAVALLGNYQTIKRRLNKSTSVSETGTEVSMNPLYDLPFENMIGNDLLAWKNDSTFFDTEADTLTARLLEEMVTLTVETESVQKDLYVTVLDYQGKPMEGIEFEVILSQGEKQVETLVDGDKDGKMVAEKLPAGEYKLSLSKVEGYITPDTSIRVTVKDKLEYSVIDSMALNVVEQTDSEKSIDDLMVVSAKESAEKNHTKTFGSDERNLYGIDILNAYGEVDFKSVYDSGIRFVMARAGYRGAISGDLVIDEAFSEYAKTALRNGLDVGAYFFSQAVNEREAVEEASVLVNLLKEEEIHLTYPVIIRVDQAGGLGRADALDEATRTKIVKAFCETVKNAGYEAGFYASSNWLTTNLDVEKLKDYTIWMAEHKRMPSEKDYYYDLWQYTSLGKVPGVNGEVALNLSFKNQETNED